MSSNRKDSEENSKKETNPTGKSNVDELAGLLQGGQRRSEVEELAGLLTAEIRRMLFPSQKRFATVQDVTCDKDFSCGGVYDCNNVFGR